MIIEIEKINEFLQQNVWTDDSHDPQHTFVGAALLHNDAEVQAWIDRCYPGRQWCWI